MKGSAFSTFLCFVCGQALNVSEFVLCDMILQVCDVKQCVLAADALSTCLCMFVQFFDAV